MYANSLEPRALRRGIVLVLVLGMLALMALIGVTFATFAGQSLINGRNFAQGVARPQAEALMDYALGQLINDTNNPTSAIRGHSLLRDVYGNESLFRGSDPTVSRAADTGGLLSQVYIPGVGTQTLHFTNASLHSTKVVTPFYNQIQYQTNIPTYGRYYGLDFTRWVIRFPGGYVNNLNDSGNKANFNTAVTQTFEVLEDDASGSFHVFTLNASLVNPTNDPTYTAPTTSPNPLSSTDWTAFLYLNPNNGAANSPKPGPPVVYTYTQNYSSLAKEYNADSDTKTMGTLNPAISPPFVLDGRYMRAFNGPGLTRADTLGMPANYGTGLYPYNMAAYGNFRLNGSLLAGSKTFAATPGNPDDIGMDEDYDACDLENWFLAIQSADGQVMIPSFHRPGILTVADWSFNSPASPAGNPGPYGNPKILRPRQADHSPLFPADPSSLTIDAAGSGRLTYDIDNDGDGITDSVWLDLGYPVQRDPGGRLFKPLFAFMVIGLNGRLPLNTVGNIQARAIGDVSNNGADPSLTPEAASTGQVPYPGAYADNTTLSPIPYRHVYSSQTYLDAPLWDHTSHLGYSVNEINPKFALQNAPSNVYGSPAVGVSPNPYGSNYSQLDDAGVSVALTQLRNLLAGTVPTDLPYPYTGGYPITLKNNPFAKNGDVNAVAVDGLIMVVPNNVADLSDINSTGNPPPYPVVRNLPPVAGRWGEPEGIQLSNPLPAAGTIPSVGVPLPGLPLFTTAGSLSHPILNYNNPVRAGRSFFNNGTNGTNDITDDDFDGTDPYFTPILVTNPLHTDSPPTLANQFNVTRNFPEQVDLFDNSGQLAVPSERSRRFVTPADPAGTGRLIDFPVLPITASTKFRPANDSHYGYGYDTRGRTSFFRYFRPPGMPQEVRYPFGSANANYPYAYAPSGNGVSQSAFRQQYLMPLLFPAGQIAGTLPGTSDVASNKYHGLQSMMTPNMGVPTPAQVIATMGTMPFDWDLAINASNTPPGDVPMGYNAGNITLLTPTINPYLPLSAPPTMLPQLYNPNPILTSASTSQGPNLGAVGNGGPYPIPYANYGGTSGQSAYNAPVVNGYLGGGLNKDEADEMNLYNPSRYDMPYGPSDLEWLYRKHDVDGATLTSRLSKLAPVSFLNPADGLTRRRLFSTDTWDLTSFSYANDNPAPYAGVLMGAQTDHDFTYNSRFTPNASPSLEGMNQVTTSGRYANPVTTEFLPNPTFPPQSQTAAGPKATFLTASNGDYSTASYIPNSSYIGGGLALPTSLDPTQSTSVYPGGIFKNHQFPNASDANYFNLITSSGKLSASQVMTPSVAHRDRKINLNFPLPISNDPAEPIRQKWCRETYQMLKAILPPSSVDTPEELAALSQFVVNIVDFRDTDCSMTRFVNTDLVVTDVLTHSASPIQPTTGANYDTTWNVSPGGVRYATSADLLPLGHFPYDPSIYNPDVTTPFLVQHGMEYNPIALNEAMAYKAQGGSPLADYWAMFIELVNTLTEEKNNTGPTNASTVSLDGWDLIIAPDNFGWGRPDPISGDVSPIAWPPFLINASNSGVPLRSDLPAVNSSNADLFEVQQARLTGVTVQAIQGAAAQYTIVGGYKKASGNVAGDTVEGTTPVTLTGPTTLPAAFIPSPTTLPLPGQVGRYYWVYLRRPANPFDTQPLSGNSRPNREMVVVDAMRFAYIDAGTTPPGPPGPPTGTSPNYVFSAQRLQPYRGGHLVPVDTQVGAVPKKTADGTTDSPAKDVPTICPPSPPYAYGYSEQNSVASAAGARSGKTGATNTTQAFYSNISTAADNNPHDTRWSLMPFHDRDFSSVAELLQVPGCPPGLFTKQFIEEPYPGNILTTAGAAATGRDDRYLTSANLTTAPSLTAAPEAYGRKDFVPAGASTAMAPNPTFPYLPDNFYYTAASVAPAASKNLPTGYTQLTTEIGGWTGTGWHKMLEFFEVPSSANGAIGTADGGDNYDWARAAIKPGQLNINLIIDEEVFAGLIDDPRLNEQLAFITTGVPFVVSQIDGNGYPVHDTTTGVVHGQYPVFAQASQNALTGDSTGNLSGLTQVGRGYVYRDPNVLNYDATKDPIYRYQQVHGLKAAFSDFLKLKHGGSGYLFGFGAGPTGSGDFALALPVPLVLPTQPLAAERPYHSLSYPDINYTVMRPASLPPSPADTAATPRYTATNPPLPSDTTIPANLTNLFSYASNTVGVAPGVAVIQLNPAFAPQKLSLPVATVPPAPPQFQYVADPGVKNPYLAIQYVNYTSPIDSPAGSLHLAPPYATRTVPSTTPPPAPFPPPIPPTPARRLFQIADVDNHSVGPPQIPSSNASLRGQYIVDGAGKTSYVVNQQVTTTQLSSTTNSPPTLIPQTRTVFSPDNYTPTSPNQVNNYLGAGPVVGAPQIDYRQHPTYRTEMLQKITNLTTVRTNQFAVWITVGFFEVVRPGTAELGITDVLGQEVGLNAGTNVRFRSFFVIDRTRATGFNPYYPGNFRDCVTYRRRIE